MTIKTITAATVERDALGFWTHPDFFEPANGNEFGVEGEFDAWKALNRVTGAISWMECEENAEELQAAYDVGDCDISMWQPTPPAGDSWFLASIHEAEDGPVCYWLRPIECDPEALAAHIDKCYAEAFQNEYLIDERNAALNACALIAETLGIAGAVAGDTIARVQQLVAENATLRSDAREVAIDAANSIAYAIFNLSDKTLSDLKPGIIDTTCPTGSALIAERNLREFAASLRVE